MGSESAGFFASPERFVAVQIGGAVLLLLLVVFFLVRRVGPWRTTSGTEGRWTRMVLALWLALAGVTAVNQVFSGWRRADPSGIHVWDLFHTALSTKYFPELGYHRLYECALAIGLEPQEQARIARLRDMRTLATRPARPEAYRAACEARFSPSRRQEFQHDLRLLLAPVQRPGGGPPPAIFTDYGYLGPPVQAMVAGSVLRAVDFTHRKLWLLTLTDTILLLGAFLLVLRAFGLRTCLLTVVFFSVSFAHTASMGGSFLRFAYLATILAGLALLRLRHHALGGVLLGWATMDRIFPGAFLFAYAVKAAVDAWRGRRLSREHLVVLGAAAATLAGLFLISLLQADGWQHWQDFAARTVIRTKYALGKSVGLANLFLAQPMEAYARTRALPELLWIYYPVAGASVVAAATLLARRLSQQSFTILFGVIVIFAGANLNAYYCAVFTVLCVLELEARDDPGTLVSAAAVCLYGLVAVVTVNLDWSHLVGEASRYRAHRLLTGYTAALLGGLVIWLWLRGRGQARHGGSPVREPQRRDPPRSTAPQSVSD